MLRAYFFYPFIEHNLNVKIMSYLNFNTSLEYFNSIIDSNNKSLYGKAVNDNNGCYHIKFYCNIELARIVREQFAAQYPKLYTLYTFHVTKNKDAVIFGGKFPVDSRAKNILYDLLDKYKATHGKRLAIS